MARIHLSSRILGGRAEKDRSRSRTRSAFWTFRVVRNAAARRGVALTMMAGIAAMMAAIAVGQVPVHAQTLPTGSAPNTVTLSLAEYNRLVDRGATAPRRADDPPIPAVISRAELAVRANNDIARGTLTLYGEVFRSGATSVPLLAGGTVLDAQLSGSAVPLMMDGSVYKAILPGGKPFTLTLTWATAIGSEPGRAVITLPIVAASSVRATVDTPGDHADVRVDNGMITRRAGANGRTQTEMTLQTGATPRVIWSSREATATTAPREVRLLSDVRTLATIGEVDMKLAALFDVTVVQGEPAKFEIHLPPGFEVSSASGASVEGSPERTSSGVISLTVREPARRRHQFLVTLERPLASAASTSGAGTTNASAASVGGIGSTAGAASTSSAGSAGSTGGAGADSNVGIKARHEIPMPWLEGAQRETGEIAIEGIGTLDLNAEAKAPLHRIDASEVSGPLQSLSREAVIAAFRYQRRAPEPVSLALNVQRFPEAPVLAAIAERAVVTTLVTTQGRALTEINLTVRNQGQPFLKVGLPAGASLVSAEVGGSSVKPVEGADGARVPLLRVGFRPSGPYQVSFVYTQSGTAFEKKGDAAMTLARLDIPISVLQWELYLPDRYEVKKFDGDVLASDRVPYVLTNAEEYAPGMPADAINVSTAAIAESPKPCGVCETVEITGRQNAQAQAQAKSGDKKDQPVAQELSVNVQNLQRRVTGVLPVRIDVPHAGHSYNFVRALVVDEDTTVRFRYKSR